MIFPLVFGGEIAFISLKRVYCNLLKLGAGPTALAR